jgi:hypothetical protein
MVSLSGDHDGIEPKSATRLGAPPVAGTTQIPPRLRE